MGMGQISIVAKWLWWDEAVAGGWAFRHRLLTRDILVGVEDPFKMTRLLVLYNQPADAAAFDVYYRDKHIPLAKTIPGVRSCTVSAQAPGLMAGGPAPYLVAELDFDSPADFQAALASPEGQATAADLANFAQAGVTLVSFDVKSV